MSNGNPFYVHPGQDYSQGLQGLSQAFAQAGENKQKKEAEKRAVEKFATMKQGAIEAYRSNDPDKAAEFSILNPEWSQALMTASKFRSKRTEENYRDSLFDFYKDSSIENAQDLIQSRQQILMDEGVGPDGSVETDTFIEKYMQNPERTKEEAGMELAFRYPDKWKAMQSAMVDEKEDSTKEMKNFDRYQTLLRESPEKADDFAAMAGIKKEKKDTRTQAIKEFEYGEKNPKFLNQKRQNEDDKASKEAKGRIYKDSRELRKEFLNQSKDYQKIRDAYKRVIKSTDNPSPAGDLALIFNYMKMLDPGSVVRESEFATAASAGSYGERMKATVNKVTAGERLSESMRSDFLTKSKSLFDGTEAQHNKRKKNYTQIAENNNLPIEDVVIDIGLAEEPPTITTQEERDSLPTGTVYLMDGKKYRKQ